MSNTPFSILISRTKWRKLWLLVKEIIATMSFQVGTLCGFGRVNRECVQTSSGTNSANEVGDTKLVEFPGKIAKHFTWEYGSQVAVNSEILSRSAIVYRQDRFIKGDEIQIEHTYQLSEISNASVCSNGVTHVSIYGADDRCLPEYSYVKYGRNRPPFREKKRHLAIDCVIPGITLNLYGNVENTAGNYGHWMVDGVGLLHLALREYSIDDIDHFLVPVMRYEFQKTSLLALGVPEHKIIELPVLSCYRFERLICATAPRGHSSCVIPGWLIDSYRSALLPQQCSSTHKRLYISRRDASSRKFVNEDEITQLMENAGFEIIELSQFNFFEKIGLFANAEIIVGLTGAGLTNLIFCSKNAHIVEVFPTNFVTYFYASIAGHLGLDHRALILENHSLLGRLNKYYGNLSLDPHLLKNVLKDLL